jgi:hypothetical protein
MKRTITILVILVLLGAAVFGVGYLQIRLKDGHTAVLHSKTSGWDQEPIEPGRFSWRWELLIPNNATLHQFPMATRSINARGTSLLPSADLYATMLENSPSFRQNIRLRIRYRVSADALVRLAPTGLSPDSFEEWYEDTDTEIASEALLLTGRAVEEFLDTDVVAIPVSHVADFVRDGLETRFGDLEILAVVVETLEVPDPELYRLARTTFQTVHAAREAALIEAATATAANQAAGDQQVAILQRYGELFTDYPILLDYLEIAARTGRDPLNTGILQSAQEADQP